MSKFRIKMKLTGLELEIEGTRDEMPQIAGNLGRQFTGLLQPATGIIAGEIVAEDVRASVPTPTAIVPVTENGSGTTKKRQPRKRRTTGGTLPVTAAGQTPATPADLVVDFTHNESIYGKPKQEWNTVTKALWLLYIVGEQANRRELTAQEITLTFNRHFREAGQIIVQNTARDLGKQRAKGKDAPVSVDTTMDPNPWYLTEAGQEVARELVAQALGRTMVAEGGNGVDGERELFEE